MCSFYKLNIFRCIQRGWLLVFLHSITRDLGLSGWDLVFGFFQVNVEVFYEPTTCRSPGLDVNGCECLWQKHFFCLFFKKKTYSKKRKTHPLRTWKCLELTHDVVVYTSFGGIWWLRQWRVWNGTWKKRINKSRDYYISTAIVYALQARARYLKHRSSFHVHPCLLVKKHNELRKKVQKRGPRQKRPNIPYTKKITHTQAATLILSPTSSNK